MELGQKLKQARLEAGLSQRQLCGDTITRNMLSQIENGSARPSFSTLQILSSRLGKPLSYFMENAPSENLALLHQASQAAPKEAMEILKGYLSPDPMLEDWYRFLLAHCRMELAKQALSENRVPYAQSLLREDDFTQGRYFPLLKKEYLLLQYRANMAPMEPLPDNTEEMLLRADAARKQGNYERCLEYLDGADSKTARWFELKSDALMALERYEEAIACLMLQEETREIYGKLELCYQKLKNYEKAYEYACKQR